MDNINYKKTKQELYLAGPLFSDAEKKFNKELKQILKPYFDVYLPQEDGGLLISMLKAGLPSRVATKKVFENDIRAIEECNLFLIILDGRSIDEGAAFELGFAYAKNKPCYGLKTDPRQLFPTGNNPMIDCPLRNIFESVDKLVEWAKTYEDSKVFSGTL